MDLIGKEDGSDAGEGLKRQEEHYAESTMGVVGASLFHDREIMSLCPTLVITRLISLFHIE